jgi:hypothetical protein
MRFDANWPEFDVSKEWSRPERLRHAHLKTLMGVDHARGTADSGRAYRGSNLEQHLTEDWVESIRLLTEGL